MRSRKENIITPLNALEKARKYCAYSERSQYDVRLKIREWKQESEVAEWIIAQLIQENFLNEERFVLAYTRGKLRQNRWGRIKIKHALKQKQISNYLINKAMQSIEDEEYIEILRNDIEKRTQKLKTLNFAEEQKIASYFQQRGFELNLVFDIIKEVKNQDNDR